MRKAILLATIFCVIALSRSASAEYYFEDVSKFKNYNPDGQKYEFVQAYITSLTYLYSNEKKSDKISSNFSEASDIQATMDYLSASTVNLRIARNYLKKYLKSDNKLIRKATDMLSVVCDAQIDLNKSEYALFKEWKEAHLKEEKNEGLEKEFILKQKNFAFERKDSLAQLLEVTLLITKVLISSETNDTGDLTNLSLTNDQRKNILERLDVEFVDPLFKGDIREGQTFLQASVVMLRTLLEDLDWGTIKG